MSSNLRKSIGAIAAVSIGAIYGIAMRLIIATQITDGIVLTIGFLVIMPLALGILTIVIAPHDLQTKWTYIIFMPWISGVLVSVIAAAILEIELLICVLMASPIIVLLSSLGGVIGWGILKLRESNPTLANVAVVFSLALPMMITPFEVSRLPPDRTFTIVTTVDIEAPPEMVWQYIVEVDTIDASEHRPTFSALLGIPQPLEAQMDYEHNTRYGRFDDGLLFIEEITAWELHEHIAFGIQADTTAVTNPAFRQIGGQYFEVTDAAYSLERLPNGHTRLHLTSTHRLSTYFNGYSSLWSRVIMRDFQLNVLHIVQERVHDGLAAR